MRAERLDTESAPAWYPTATYKLVTQSEALVTHPENEADDVTCLLEELNQVVRLLALTKPDSEATLSMFIVVK